MTVAVLSFSPWFACSGWRPQLRSRTAWVVVRFLCRMNRWMVGSSILYRSELSPLLTMILICAALVCAGFGAVSLMLCTLPQFWHSTSRSLPAVSQHPVLLRLLRRACGAGRESDRVLRRCSGYRQRDKRPKNNRFLREKP